MLHKETLNREDESAEKELIQIEHGAGRRVRKGPKGEGGEIGKGQQGVETEKRKTSTGSKSRREKGWGLPLESHLSLSASEEAKGGGSGGRRTAQGPPVTPGPRLPGGGRTGPAWGASSGFQALGGGEGAGGGSGAPPPSLNVARAFDPFDSPSSLPALAARGFPRALREPRGNRHRGRISGATAPARSREPEPGGQGRHPPSCMSWGRS